MRLELLYGINIGNELSCAVFATILLVAVNVKPERSREMKSFSLCLFTMIVAMLSDVAAYFVEGEKNAQFFSSILNCLTYSMGVISVYCFLCYMISHSEECYNRKTGKALKILMMVSCAMAIILYISSLWNGLIFTINENGTYSISSFGYLAAVSVIPLIAANMIIIIRNVKVAPARETILYIGFTLGCTMMGVTDAVLMTTIHYTGMITLAALIYILIEMKRDRLLAEKNRELIVSEMNARRLQMNPHYIYNVLASIDGLTVIDPPEARKLIRKFTKHLRSSYLNEMPEKISFAAELENLEYYIAVEQARFPGVVIEYDIQCDDFELPPLVIQPIVENSIKYGICGRDDSSGTVTIESFEADDAYIIRISDDGIGFDTNAPLDTNSNHIGLSNTMKRLELICDGKMDINSIPERGTQTTITIPKEKK